MVRRHLTMNSTGTACTISPHATERRARLWVFGAFVICPCHLPLTLALGAAVFSGTALGALLTGHPYIAGTGISLAWVAATWRGFYLLRVAQRARTGAAV
jgi:mercuric ion transport protein